MSYEVLREHGCVTLRNVLPRRPVLLAHEDRALRASTNAGLDLWVPHWYSESIFACVIGDLGTNLTPPETIEQLERTCIREIPYGLRCT